MCRACKKSKNLLKLIGGPEVKMLYNHVGRITDTNSWEETTGKISRGIRGQTNQASARFKLMQKLPQGDTSFSEWYPNVRDQAGRCTWEGYNADGAARDTILLQTKDKQLQQKILTEDLNYANTVKYGLSLEQGKKKIDEIIATRSKMEDNRAAQLIELREEVNRLKQGQGKKTEAIKSTCDTCTRPTHGKGACPGKKVECYGCGQMGHFKGSNMQRKNGGEEEKEKQR